MKKISLYIHIPFCKKICSYCDFPKILLLERFIKPYLSSLFDEIKELPKIPIKTIFIGGGSPLALKEEDLEALFKCLEENLDLRYLEEYSIESTSEEVNDSKIKLLKKYNVNRLSIGIETLQDNLTYLNRYTKKEKLLEIKKLLQENKFENYNFDLIYGWPKSSLEAFIEDLNFVISLNPKHISIYPLAIEEGTYLHNIKLQQIEDDEYAEIYIAAKKVLEQHGFHRYEVSNFSKVNYESKHNITYWHSEDYLAAGLGATSFYNGIRAQRTRNISKYIKKEYYAEKQKEDIFEQKNDFVMLNLRLDKGFTFQDYQEKFNSNFIEDYQKEVENTKEYLIIDNKGVRVKEENIYILDSILVDLLK